MGSAALLEIRVSTRTEPVLAAVGVVAILLLIFAALFYAFVTWRMSLGFGVAHSEAWATNPAALDTLATRYAGTWLSIIIDLSVALSGFVAALGGVHLTARTLLAIGRDGGLPRAFAWTHPRFKSPWVGVITSAAITLVICGYTIYKSVVPKPPHPIDEAPYIAGIWIVLGILVLLWLRARSRTGSAASARRSARAKPPNSRVSGPLRVGW